MATRMRLTPGAMRRIGARRVAPVLEAAAVMIRDEVVLVMESSAPTGRIYQIPGTGTTYQASAPGEPPAIREGVYRDSWHFAPAVDVGGVVRARAFTALRVGRHVLGELLEYGTSRMAPRPHVRVALESVKPSLQQLVRDASAA